MTSPDERIIGLLKDARRQLEAERSRRSEPIAIVGVGCRFPGGASGPAAFWRVLCDGRDASSDVPADRWDAASFYDPDAEVPGKAYTKRGSFLDRIDTFDAGFFGISPREALGMDPQQRLLLEVVWEALEDAGIAPERLRGSPTGVWCGLCAVDYARKSLQSGDPADIDAYNALGNTGSIAAGRISYFLDLRGPAVQLDTACSSSLVAVHQACQSLRSGECDLALVAGVNLMSAPEMTVALCKLRALSRDGRCKTFDASADGYGRGEGCGIVVLKRLRDARSASDRIYACVRGSALNHDGHSNGLTAPNGLAQEAVIRAALANAGVDPADVGYVEAHGTGTLLGDPIEVLALSRVYGPGRPTDSPLYLGAVKTLFGHLEGAAGVAGLIKLALCLWHGELTRNLHVSKLNPKIPWSILPVRVAMESIVWPRNRKVRIAGVSSFGISGTNAHVVVEEAPEVELAPPAPRRSAEFVVLSAKTAGALTASAARLREHLEAHPALLLADVAYNLATTRSVMDQRLALSVSTREALCDALHVVEQGETPIGVTRGDARESRGKLAWLFTGQGAQVAGMGRSLHAEWGVFREALEGACASLDQGLERPLLEAMWAEPGTAEAGLLDQTAYTQPALFAVEWALAALWRSWGVEPDLLAGHSIGEITAACVAGVFTLADAARLVGARGRLMQALPAGGVMVSIAAQEADVASAVAPYAAMVSLAAVNAPSSVVIAGAEREVFTLAENFERRGVQTKRLAVSHAFHSPLVDSMLGEFRQVAESIAYKPPSTPIVSSVSGQLAGIEISTADYWVRHVRQTVRFHDAVGALHNQGVDAFLEVGPKPTLLGLVAAGLPDHQRLLLESLRPGRLESQTMLQALGDWFVRGGAVVWSGVFPEPRSRVSLPSYAWQRERYWIDGPAAEAKFGRGNRASQMPPNEAQEHTREIATIEAEPTKRLVALSSSELGKAMLSLVQREVARIVPLGNGTGVRADARLVDIGFESLKALELQSALRRQSGVDLSLSPLPDQLTCEMIASHLVAKLLESPGVSSANSVTQAALCESLDRVQKPSTRLFCFHDAGGAGSMFAPFIQLSRCGVEVHAISHVRRAPPSPERARSYLDIAVAYVRSWSQEPFALMGHSLGALFAWRVVQELMFDGGTRPILFIPSAMPPILDRDISSVIDAGRVSRAIFGAELQPGVMTSVEGDIDADLSLWRAMPGRPCPPMEVPIAAFLGREDALVSEPAMLEWGACTLGDSSVTVLPGDHAYPHRPSSRQLLIDELERILSVKAAPDLSSRQDPVRRRSTTHIR